MKSDNARAGMQQAPARSLFNALGFTAEEMKKPMVGIVSSYNEIVPGHMNIDKIVDAVKLGVAEAGGVPQAQKADAGSGGGAVVDRQSGGLRGSDQRYFPGVRLSQRGIFGVHDGTLHSVQAAGKAVRLKKVTEDIPRKYCLRGISSVMRNYLIDLK